MTSADAQRAPDPRPVYSEVMEDGEVIVAALAPRAGEIAVSVASAGDNVFRLALEPVRHVFGVDLNPVQVELCRLVEAGVRWLEHEELAGLAGVTDVGPDERSRLLERVAARAGTSFARAPEVAAAVAERGLAGCGRLTAFVAPLREALTGIVGAEPLAALLSEPERARRERLWDETFGRPEVVELLGAALNRDTISDAFIPASAFERMASPEFHLHYHEVLRHLCVELDPRGNHFLHRLWLGRFPSPDAVPVHLARAHGAALARRADAITWHRADVLDLLRTLPDGSVDVYNLSNVLDWSAPAHFEALWREVDRTAADGARAFLRSFLVEAPPPPDVAERWTADPALSRAMALADRVGYFSRYELWTRARARA